MPNEFIATVSAELQQTGCLVENAPRIPSVPALLYARSPGRYPLGFAKVEDHFVFIDWGNAAFERLDRLKEIYQHFSAFANQGFHIPHALRMQIPNLAVVAVSQHGFPVEAIQFARSTYLGPWYGGETRQLLLVDLLNRQVIVHRAPGIRRWPVRGIWPLAHAVRIIQPACQRAFLI